MSKYERKISVYRKQGAYVANEDFEDRDEAIFSVLKRANTITARHFALEGFIFPTYNHMENTTYNKKDMPKFTVPHAFFNEVAYYSSKQNLGAIKKVITVLNNLDALLRTSTFVSTDPNRYKYLNRASKDKSFTEMAISFHVVKDKKGYFPVMFLVKRRESGENTLHFVRVGHYMDKAKVEKIGTKKEVTPAVTYSPYAIGGKENSKVSASDSNNGRLVTSYGLTIPQWASLVNDEDEKIISFFPKECLSEKQLKIRASYLAEHYVRNYENRLEENNIPPLYRTERATLLLELENNVENSENILNEKFKERSPFSMGSPLDALSGTTFKFNGKRISVPASEKQEILNNTKMSTVSSPETTVEGEENSFHSSSTSNKWFDENGKKKANVTLAEKEDTKKQTYPKKYKKHKHKNKHKETRRTTQGDGLE